MKNRRQKAAPKRHLNQSPNKAGPTSPRPVKGSPPPPRPEPEQVAAEWAREILDHGRKGAHVMASWHKQNRTVPEPVFGRMVESLRRRLHAGNPATEAPARWPDWIRERLQSAWGARSADIIRALESSAPLFLRVNSLRTDPAALTASLAAEGITVTATSHFPSAMRVAESGRAGIFRCQAFKDGHFEIQDLHAQAIVPMLQVKAGQTVIDACAGEGGKTLQLAACMENRGRIRAFDPNPRKLEQLRLRARRAGVFNMEARETPTGPAARRLKGTADAVLIDAPCSATGVIRRHPEIKWKLRPEDIAELAALQGELLTRYAAWAKPGGRVLFCTCSLLPEEAEHVVAAFLQNNPERFRLIEEHRWWPDIDAGDGFYAALLEHLS